MLTVFCGSVVQRKPVMVPINVRRCDRERLPTAFSDTLPETLTIAELKDRMLEDFILKGQDFAVMAEPGHKLYGENHSCAGISAGTNGLMVIEHSGKYISSVLTLDQPLCSPVHVTVVYRNGQSALYINGKLAAEGIISGRTVHPGSSSSWTLYGEALSAGQVQAIFEQAGKK